ncbi:MAG: UDP-GlcNAc:undecaprenyl-phosphate/decaprenyl-phosphate GlcNAc-phosphate transferase [Actinomycetota bacterium]|nr:UDP-GlcNAc:undecaprenyl-phosphate/decaprenyl-phosphate GlcNAc-phosphate transferase [Actinomycetota bacterium]
MTGSELAAASAAAVTGAAVCGSLLRRRLRAAIPPHLMRVNVSGRRVPIVLAPPIACGTGAGLLVGLVVVGLTGGSVPARLAAASCVVFVSLWLAGTWDDRRGDELPRGFTGHLEAARRLRLTGGILKLLVGCAAGLIAGAIVAHGMDILEVALAVALGANLINLLDRAPGRAGKIALLAMLPLAVLGAGAWTACSAGVIASLAVALPPDLKEKAMLGDAGANPVGALLGLGLGVSLPEIWLVIAIAVMLGLNLASERWSFSQFFARIPMLNAFDRIGRR